MKHSKQRKNMPIWIDMTDMLVWRGSFTGIQRVTYEYAKRFSSDNARFCAFDKIDNRFFEVTLEFIDKLQNNEEITDKKVSFRSKLRRTLGMPYRALPEAHRERLRPMVGRVNHIVRYVMSKTISRNHREVSIYGNFPTAEFSPEERVVLIGAGWNEMDALKKLVDIKVTTPIKIVQHLNDILPIYQPQLFSEELPSMFQPYVDLVIRNTQTITVISEATRRDIEIYCQERDIDSPEICVVRLGDDVAVTKPQKPSALTEDERYIFALGTFEVRKNYILLYQALKLAQLEQRELPKIVIAGRKGWLSSDIAYVIQHDPYTREHLIWLQDVSDAEIDWLFENALFTVFPSIAEGWGLPVVESLRHGKMSLVSGVSSMLEIGEGLVDYFLPYDARECMEKMQYYLAEDRYVTTNQRVKDEYEVFTWDESYQRFKKAVQNS